MSDEPTDEPNDEEFDEDALVGLCFVGDHVRVGGRPFFLLTLNGQGR